MTKLQRGYIEAALHLSVTAEEFSCNAVYRIAGYSARQLYEQVMEINSIAQIEEAVGDISESPAAKNFREWLLCMMAACCEDFMEDAYR